MAETILKVNSNPDVYRVLVPFKGPGIDGTNCYVVRDGDESIIVDSGAPSDEAYAVLDAALDELGVDRSHARFFLTHFHNDHAGLLDRIAPPEASVYANEADVDHMLRLRTRAYREELFERMRSEGMPASELDAFRKLTVSFVSFDPARHDMVYTCDGDEISCGRFRFRVITTPGHTVGHQTLFHPASGLLFSGDHILFVTSSSVDFSPHGADGLQCFLDSLDAVAALPVSKLLYSHGELRDDWRERIEWLKSHRAERADEAYEAVAHDEGCTGYEAVRRISWNVPFDAWDKISLVQRWCIVGEGLVYLDHLVSTGDVVKEPDETGVYRYCTAESAVLF